MSGGTVTLLRSVVLVLDLGDQVRLDRARMAPGWDETAERLVMAKGRGLLAIYRRRDGWTYSAAARTRQGFRACLDRIAARACVDDGPVTWWIDISDRGATEWIVEHLTARWAAQRAGSAS